ncbi:MAG: PAS domain S-box protein [Steroidobacteraceae bacterium]
MDNQSIGESTSAPIFATFKELMSNVNLFAVMFSSTAKIIYCNGHFLRVTGLSLDQLMGRSWNEVFASPGAGNFSGPFSDWLESKFEASHHESDLLTREGEVYWVRWNNIPLRDTSGTVVGSATLGEDITEHRQLERALLDAGARERRKLEGELHDGLGQELFGLALSARGIAESAKQGRSPSAEDIDRLIIDLNHAIDTCRRISQGYSPLSDVDGGLTVALRNLITTQKDSSGPALDFVLVQVAPLTLPAETLDHIYRLVQEGLTNALRHADANSIKVILDIQRTAVTLEIMDDGIGLPMQAASLPGMGLKLMRYRANAMRGHIQVAQRSTRGTHLILRIEQAAE